MLFEAALQDYQKKTGIALAKHPLAEQLQYCNSIKSVTVVLRDRAQAFREFREKYKVLKPLKKVLTVLQNLTSSADLGQNIDLVCP